MTSAESSTPVDLVSLVFAADDQIEAVAQALSARLDLSFELHDSLYRGGDYWLGGSLSGEHVIVQVNADLDEPAEDVDSPTIVYVEATSRSTAFEDAGAAVGLLLLRRTEWERS